LIYRGTSPEMSKVYIAAPLFSEIEKRFNLELNQFIKSLGFDTYLPQLDGGLVSELIKQDVSRKRANIIKMVFERDLDAIKKADILVFVLDGRVPDEGGCVELGIAYALGKRCVGYKTDVRSLVNGTDNLMITGILGDNVARNFSELASLLRGLKVG